jgi:hypothetical protein
MSTRYEGVGASSAGTGWESPGAAIGDDTLERGQYALVINYDEVFYIQGTPDELRAFLVRLDERLQNIEAHSTGPVGYGDVTTDEDGDYRCPRCEMYWSPQDQGDLFSLLTEVKAHLDLHNPQVAPVLQ